ncbi:MAG: nickel-dependent lactate racemase [Anaerolineae bacterium]|jgi:nickel-dependent lactate racemase
MKVQVPHGHETLEMVVPDGQVVGVVLPRTLPVAPNPEALARQAIATSFERYGLPAKAASGKPGGTTACIAITDRTRSTPNQLLLPILLDELHGIGVPDDKITIISGGGMHAPDTHDDLRHTVGPEILERVDVITNEPDNDRVMVALGKTALGTPVELHQRFAQADVKIGVINVNPCMLAGWSGGGKIVQPAVASRRSIYHNHREFVQALMDLRCGSLMGIMPPDNPVRADIEQCAEISGIDLIVNTVLGDDRQLVDLFCGDVVSAHRAAVDLMAPYVEVSLPEAVDILIAGVGDPALEVSLFQGGSRVCGGADRYLRPGGTLIMVNACDEGIYEGFEHEEYREWMRSMPTPAEIGQLVKDGEMGGEKGCVLFTFSWLLHEMGCRIILVTEGMTAAELKEIHLDHASSLQRAVDQAISSYDGGPSIGIMPYGGLILPKLPVTSSRSRD